MNLRALTVQVTACAMIATAVVSAQTVTTWTTPTTGTQQWGTPANWTPAPPATGDTARITIPADQTLQFTASDTLNVSLVNAAGAQTIAGTNKDSSKLLITGGSLIDTNTGGVTFTNLTIDIPGGYFQAAGRRWLSSSTILNISGGTMRTQGGLDVSAGAVITVSGGRLEGGNAFSVAAGGTINISDGWVGGYAERFWVSGTINASGGTLHGQGQFDIINNAVLNIDGDVVQTGSFYMGRSSTVNGSVANINLNSGSLQAAGTLNMSYSAGATVTTTFTSRLNIHGGTFNPDTPRAVTLNVPYHTPVAQYGRRAEYLQDGGVANITTLTVGSSGGGTFAGGHPLGYPQGASVTIDGGMLNVDTLNLGVGGTVNLGRNSDLTMSGGTMVVATALNLYRSMTQTEYTAAVAALDPTYATYMPVYNPSFKNDVQLGGGTIVLDSAAFTIRSQDETGNVDLSGGRLLFSGGGNVLEAPGFDYGEVVAGYWGNYALGTLELADGALMSLQDLFDNVSADAGAPEAVYVRSLVLGAGSTLDLNGLNLYAGVIADAGATFPNGTPFWVPIPEPTTLALLGLSVVGLLARRRQAAREMN